MNTILMAIKSRTNWTLAIMWLVNNQAQVQSFIPSEYHWAINGVLILLAGYFHMNPQQSYGDSVLNK